MIRTLIISAVIILAAVFLFNSAGSSPVSEYFPIAENNLYVFVHKEGKDVGLVNITVKNVKKNKQGLSFDFYWQGKYNDRIQKLLLSSAGIFLDENKHLVGEVPLKVIRRYSRPILMIPSGMEKSIYYRNAQLIYNYDHTLIAKEDIEGHASFVGVEKISTPAGVFTCRHYFLAHIYKDASGNSMLMHVYNFWLAKGVGHVKMSHIFTHLDYYQSVETGEKTIMNRYSAPFVEMLELKKAVIQGKVIGG